MREAEKMIFKSSLPIGLWSRNSSRTKFSPIMKQITLQQRIGESLRKHREALGISQEAFAEQVHMHRTYYSAIERGEKNLTLATLNRVCDGLHTPVWEVLKDAEE